MDGERKTAVFVGILFVIGTVSGGVCAALTDPIRNSPDGMAGVYAQEGRMILAAFFWLATGLTLAMVPVVAYPLLSRYNRVLAPGCVVFRGGLETATYRVGAAGWLILPALRPAYEAGGAAAPLIQALGISLFNAYEIGSAGTIVFCLGALMFYYIVPAQPHPPLAVGVGPAGGAAAPGRGHPGIGRVAGSAVAGHDDDGSAAGSAGNGDGPLADRQGLSPVVRKAKEAA